MTHPRMFADRRRFLQGTAALTVGSLLARASALLQAADAPAATSKKEPLFKISLAEWSLHRMLFEKKLDHLGFAQTAKQEFGITAVEYVNQFFKDQATDEKYLAEMKKRCEDNGVRSLLIMCDGEGNLGDPDVEKRKQAVKNHHKWVEAAAFLGCHSIRVNAASSGSYEDQLELAADGLHELTEFAEQHNLFVLVENHGGLSSNGEWLSAVMRKVDHPHCGTLPDFGNFAIDRAKDEWYDRYKGVEEMMPFAQAVSAKSHDFDDARPLVTIDKRSNKETDFLKMMKIVLEAGYCGHLGIEYEGQDPDEFAGIRRTKKMLEAVREKLSA